MSADRHHTSDNAFCDCMIHPFQTDPGVSQHQRLMDELDVKRAKIDARSTADLLYYFYQLATQINYYDAELKVSDWKPFFERSVPFVLADIMHYDFEAINKKFDHDIISFAENPTAPGLQHLQLFIYYQTIRKQSVWYNHVGKTEFPIERVFENLLRDKIKPALQQFVSLNRLAARWFKVKLINPDGLFIGTQPGLLSESTVAEKTKNYSDMYQYGDEYSRLLKLHNETKNIFSPLFEPIRLLKKAAEISLDQSLLPLKEDLQKKHSPHLALVFAFIRLFQILQADLNGFTKKHLDFFYKDVLRLVSNPAVGDQAHIVFEIQKELKRYVLGKGLLLKDGKDVNKEEILFALDEEIVVNHTQVKDVRTLFLNNHSVGTKKKYEALTEGLYIAPNATMADGVDKEFQTDVRDFYTVGNKPSKYTLPGTDVFKPYPSARIGFILASPVFFLREGKRTITITIKCRYDGNVCVAPADPAATNPCCEDAGGQPQTDPHLPLRLLRRTPLPLFSGRILLPHIRNARRKSISTDTGPDFDELNKKINSEYYYVSQELIAEAVKKGLNKDVADELRNFLIDKDNTKKRGIDYCYCPLETIKYDAVVDSAVFDQKINTANEIVNKFFKKRKPFDIQFSGEKEWIDPSDAEFSITPSTATTFEFKIVATLLADKGAVTFYNKEALLEDFDTDKPLAKIQLDDHFKIRYQQSINRLCLDRNKPEEFWYSLYHIFRHVRIDDGTRIDVTVCGLRNFVVQNDEGLQDVNSPIYPFGPRPDVMDFSVVNPAATYELTKDVFDTDIKNVVTGNTRKIFEDLFDALPNKKTKVIIASTVDQFNAFLGLIQNLVDKEFIRKMYETVTERYSNLNLIGPNFYIGSFETFCKKWSEVRINYGWKDKPSSFNDYYNGYIVRVDPGNATQHIYGLDADGFEIKLSLLRDGLWKDEGLHKSTPGCPEDTSLNQITNDNNRRLFPKKPLGANCSTPFCATPDLFTESIHLKNNYFPGFSPDFITDIREFSALNVNSRNGFLRINLQNQDFLHKDYAYTLARQMIASAKLPKDAVEDAVYYDSKGDPIVIDSEDFLSYYKAAEDIADRINPDVDDINAKMGNQGTPVSSNVADDIRDTLRQGNESLENDVNQLSSILDAGTAALEGLKKFAAIIPNEPWTPIISAISIDYKAEAEMGDIDLIHLYPFTGTYKQEQIQSKPTLLPTFCNEGTLYLGLEKLVPPANLNILFQLAEATSDSELDKKDVLWHYLDKNVWRPLRTGFEVIEDETQNLTSTGIIRFALPENMTTDNTIMPKDLHWISATIASGSGFVSETTGIYTQAIKVSFTNTPLNDKLRLDIPIEAGQIAKLETADASVKQVLQPYATFGGRVPEDQKLFYVRVSEHLRHKGRAIQKFDYERIILHAFPEIFKAKCINHSLGLNAHEFINDFPYAPGYVIIAVIPDLTKLKAGNSYEPKAPVSLLEKIDDYVRRRTSTFARIRTMNPRYERIHLCLKVRLLPGKDEGYYKSKLITDLRHFFAPWAIGDPYHYKLTFGQCVDRSSVIGFIESLGYIDFILEMKMRHELDKSLNVKISRICPQTPRSILLAGDIEICIDRRKPEQWCDEEPCSGVGERIIPCEPGAGKPA